VVGWLGGDGGGGWRVVGFRGTSGALRWCLGGGVVQAAVRSAVANSLRLTATFATHCNTLQQIYAHYNTMQHTATGKKLFDLQLSTHGNTLQHTATHCNTLQHTATHCNTLQHTATHCNTLQQATRARSCSICSCQTSNLHSVVRYRASERESARVTDWGVGDSKRGGGGLWRN